MKTFVSLMAILLMLNLPAHAANPFRAAELSDAELNELRGRYVMPGGIIHFGVTMSSMWENSAGQRLGAEVAFHVNSKAQPTLYVTNLSNQPQSDGGSPSVISGSGQVLGGSGLTEVRGISQSVRSAGDFNNALNDLDIVVSRGGQSATQESTSTPWSGNASFSNEVGKVLVDRQGGGLRIQLDAGTQGVAMQQIGNGNVVQQTRFTGDLNSARNMAALSVGLKDLPMGQDFANCTLEQLRALRPIGF